MATRNGKQLSQPTGCPGPHTSHRFLLEPQAEEEIDMHTLRTLKLILATTACLILASPALAVPIVFELQSGVENGFGFSGLHDADDSSPMSGSHIGSLSGDLTLDYDGVDTYSFLASTVSLASATYSFTITGGTLHTDGSGFLDFVLAGAGPYAQVASIVFAGGAPVCCGADGPNRVSPTELRLWGASNIAPSGGVAGVSKRIGMDLGAAAPVPEPSAALLFAVGALVMRGAAQRKRC